MRILEIIPQLNVGGAESFTVNLCNEFVAQGHDVFLVVTNSLDKNGNLKCNLDHRIKFIVMEKRPGPDPMLFFRLPRLISKIKPDIVHTHLGAILYTIFSPMFNKKPKYFHTVHNAAEKEATTGGRISAMARKIQFNRHWVTPITISRESQISFLNYYGNGVRSELIWNGVPRAEVHKDRVADEMSQGDIKLINVARVQPQKNQLELVKAIDTLNKSGEISSTVQLYIVGDGNQHLIDEIKQFDSPYTTLLGRKNNPRDYIARADAFILSSHYEGLPLTLIECFDTGTIPICTPVGGIIDLIRDGENGILTNGVTATDLINAIKRFIALSPQEKMAMQKASKAGFNNLTMDKCARDYLKLFDAASISK